MSYCLGLIAVMEKVKEFPHFPTFITWREYQRYKDLEGIAASKNLNGLPVI